MKSSGTRRIGSGLGLGGISSPASSFVACASGRLFCRWDLSLPSVVRFRWGSSRCFTFLLRCRRSTLTSCSPSCWSSCSVVCSCTSLSRPLFPENQLHSLNKHLEHRNCLTLPLSQSQQHQPR